MIYLYFYSFYGQNNFPSLLQQHPFSSPMTCLLAQGRGYLLRIHQLANNQSHFQATESDIPHRHNRAEKTRKKIQIQAHFKWTIE